MKSSYHLAAFRIEASRQAAQASVRSKCLEAIIFSLSAGKSANVSIPFHGADHTPIFPNNHFYKNLNESLIQSSSQSEEFG